MVAADKLSEFEELFENRYTEHDLDYKKALEGQRLMTNDVPIMNPWPPKMFGGRKRSNRNRGRERNRRHNNRGSHYSRDHSYNEQDRVSDYHHSHTTSKDVCDMVDSRNKKSLNTGETTDNQRNNITPVQAPLDAFKDSPSRPPTESDVQAILSIAGTCNTGSIDLKKEKMRQKRKPSKKPKPKLSNTETTSSKLQSDTPTALNNTRIPLKTVESDKIAVRHGSAEPITTTSMLLSEHYSKKDKSEKPLRHKRRHSVLEDDNSDSENEHIDVEGGFVPRLTVDNSPCDTQSTMKQPFYATSVNDDSTKEKSFVVHYPLKQLSLKCTKLPIDVRTNEQRMDDNVSSDGNVHIQQQKQKKEKKEKKEKKHRRHKKKELKLKIRLNADHSENSTDD